ncbi:rod shape-determining protein RodA [Leptobacterium sp. I13]|uniref:rod shape-determining protein RodA n=1 Tax=Leptobacterium meishanense TaxID=3128904 RepID=UPI0030EDD5B5
MNKLIPRIDWLTVLLYFLLVFIGWLNIYAATISDESTGIFNMSQPYGKQLLFIILSSILIVLILALEVKFYERFSNIFYLLGIISLLGLFLFGKNVNGATSWYAIGGITIQPAEFVKTTTALLIAKHLSNIQTNLNKFKDQFASFLIIALPALLIALQPDPGSALVFTAFLFPLHREGLSPLYILIGFIFIVLFVATLIFGPALVSFSAAIILFIFYSFRKRAEKKVPVFPLFIALIVAIGFSFSVQFIYDNVFEQRHRDRFSLWLRLEKDPEKLDQIRKTIGYNTYQSETTIGSGGFTGKGYLEGTRTKGHFVPEQHTDYIFSTVGEEWGFIGSIVVIILFTVLLLRLIFLAERQKTSFGRVFGYSITAILFVHFTVNIGMVIGLLPTIGIPLPFFSYGGSALWGFTILLFIFLKVDANRLNEWK